MDRMASYPDWYVTSSKGLDQVPIGHSLTGFATAFDFLYPSLDGQRRITYLKKIRETTQYLHLRLKEGKSGWTNHYIHNHSPTIVLALLMGAMVCERHDETSADLKTSKSWYLKQQLKNIFHELRHGVVFQKVVLIAKSTKNLECVVVFSTTNEHTLFVSTNSVNSLHLFKCEKQQKLKIFRAWTFATDVVNQDRFCKLKAIFYHLVSSDEQRRFFE